MTHKPHPEPYHVGDLAPHEGEYVCVPCGFKKLLKTGESFSECLSCMKDEGWHILGAEQDVEDALLDDTDVEEKEHHYHTEDNEEVAEGLELWESIQKPDEGSGGKHEE
ncbi:MAG: hypothetical protein Q7S09_03250 [bacterium]|nr:hypothetical protein [bacterium]